VNVLMALWIKNATIVTMDPRLKTIKGSILIEDQEIIAIVEDSSADVLVRTIPEEIEVVDASGMIVIPGMINAHYHSYSNLLKGTRNNVPLEIWTLHTVAYGQSLDDDDIRLAVLLGAAEMMKNGITSCVDHFPHLMRAEFALRGYEESGMRVAFAPMMHDVPDHRFLPVELSEDLYKQLDGNPVWTVSRMKEYYLDLIHRWHKKAGRIEIMLGPNAPQRCSEEMLGLCRELAEQKNLHIHTHLLETRMQAERGQRVYSKGLIGYLDDMGLLTSRLSVAHGIWLNDQEIGLLKERDITVVHNPASNMIMGSGLAPLMKYLRKGIRVALGTDASNCGGPHNLFETMRLALYIHRLGEGNFRLWPQIDDVWKMATESGAKAMGMEGKIGTISPGARADLVLLKTDSPSWAPENDILSQLVCYANGSSVDSVLINGKWTVRNGRVLTFDESEVIREVKERHTFMMKRCQKALEFTYVLEPYFERMYSKFYGFP
jgi:5-methylthioadenosine/S-adenosylhomocysteine deaminase